MTRKPADRVARLVSEVESAAKRLRADARKRAKGRPMLRSMQKAARQLREQAASAARRVEKYVHELRTELEGSAPSKPAPRRRKAARTRRKKALATG